MSLSLEYLNILLVAFILFLPKFFMRLKIPSGITAFFLGVFFINFFGDQYGENETINILSMLGITSLFLFAGMEIDLEEINTQKASLGKYLTKSLLVTALVSFVIFYAFQLSFQVSLIISIALLTPSAGFILSSIQSFKLNKEEKFWIKLKSISKEIAAITVLFVALQINDLEALLISSVVMILLLLILPKIFTFFLKFIAPYAPGTEVSFLVLVAFTTGVLTKKLGTHYLVGAFITGVAAGRFNHFMKGEKSVSILEVIHSFFAIFVPFYFFKAGMILKVDMIDQTGFIYGLIFIVCLIPFRLLSVNVGIKYLIDDFKDENKTVAKALLPNLIFGLVIVSTLKQQFHVDGSILFGIICYTIVASILPAVIFEKENPIIYDISRS